MTLKLSFIIAWKGHQFLKTAGNYTMNDIMNAINVKRPFPLHEKSWHKTALLKIYKRFQIVIDGKNCCTSHNNLGKYIYWLVIYNYDPPIYTKRKQKRSKNKRQTSKKIPTFASTFARWKWPLTMGMLFSRSTDSHTCVNVPLAWCIIISVCMYLSVYGPLAWYIVISLWMYP